LELSSLWEASRGGPPAVRPPHRLSRRSDSGRWAFAQGKRARASGTTSSALVRATLPPGSPALPEPGRTPRRRGHFALWMGVGGGPKGLLLPGAKGLAEAEARGFLPNSPGGSVPPGRTPPVPRASGVHGGQRHSPPPPIGKRGRQVHGLGVWGEEVRHEAALHHP
jgi:hypothetical protein